jgi:hypothetical protein
MYNGRIRKILLLHCNVWFDLPCCAGCRISTSCVSALATSLWSDVVQENQHGIEVRSNGHITRDPLGLLKTSLHFVLPQSHEMLRLGVAGLGEPKTVRDGTQE